MKRRNVVVSVLAVLVLAAGVITAVRLTASTTDKNPNSASSIATASAPTAPASSNGRPIYLDASYTPAERAADLVSRMTLQEKASQLVSSQAAAIPRLGIAAYGWWNEAAHGVAREGTVDGANPPDLTNTTSYPVDLSLGSTWDPALMYQEATLISDEARDVVRNHRLDLNFYSPTVNLGRDPRWGRNDETFSEDPLLTAAMASQYVDGMEGKDSTGKLLPSSGGYLKTLTTLKHFAANNSESNRLNGSADMDERSLREYYTAQFRDIVKSADPASIMSAYNSVNGTPAPVDVTLMDTLARQTFGFSGFFTSDCDAVAEVQAGHTWMPANSASLVDEFSRTAYANSAGEDLNCDQGYHDAFNYENTIPQAIGKHIQTTTDTYNENDVDVSCVRLFTARIATGEFDDEKSVPWVAAARARLSNGSWTNSNSNGAATETAGRLAMARKVADSSIVLLKNDPTSGGAPLLPLKVPSTGAFRVAVIGQYAKPTTMYLGGYSSVQGKAGAANEVDGYSGLKSAIQAIDKDATVDYLPGTAAGQVDPNDPSAIDTTVLDQASIDAASKYDAVIVYVGTDRSTSSEDNDRTTLALPGAQAQLISKVAAANPHTVVYMETVGEVDVRPFAGKVPALLWSSYNGQRKGEALADVVLGTVNPSGHLPFTWYADETQLSPVTDYLVRNGPGESGRTYMYFDGKVSFPFGYGLSYTTFSMANLKTDATNADANATEHLTADVTNTGASAGSTVVQLYVATPDAPASAQRPVKRLGAFTKVSLQPGQKKTVDFSVRVSDLAFWDNTAGHYVVDSGKYVFELASSAADGDIKATAAVQVSGALVGVPDVVTAKPVVKGDDAKGVAQRVFFPAGSEIDPQLSVSMTDSSLYGYVIKGQSKPMPPALTVKFTSNRPDVVSVHSDGTLHAAAQGVATVTAEVTYQGKTATGTFVIDVR